MPAKVVVIHGNCQAQFLHMLVGAMPSLANRFTFALSTNTVEPGEELPPVPDEAPSAVLLWDQYDDFTDPALGERLRSSVPDDCVAIRFPTMMVNAFWPFHIKDKRNVTEPGYPWGRYPFGDRVGLEVSQLGLPPERVFACYMERSSAAMPDLHSLLEFDRRLSTARDKHCDVRMTDYLFEHLRRTHHFWSHGHIATDAYAELIRRLVAKSCAAIDEPQPELEADLQDLRRRFQGQGQQIPIHPLVIEGLGLEFVGPDAKYQYFGNAWTFEEYMTRYIMFDRAW